MIKTRCKAKNIRGDSCGGYPIKGSDFCFTHDPTSSKQRAQARKRGGLHRRTRKRKEAYPGEISTSEDVLKWVNAILLDTWEQENSAQRSRTTGYLLGVALKTLEVGEIEMRIERIEFALNFQRRLNEPEGKDKKNRTLFMILWFRR